MTDSTVSKSIQQCLRPRRQLFAATRQQKNVFFYHPGYQDGHNLLLNLPALDAGGIHHETARIACAILAACRFDGYLSMSQNGPKIPDRPDDILQHKKYYFCIEDGKLDLRSLCHLYEILLTNIGNRYQVPYCAII